VISVFTFPLEGPVIFAVGGVLYNWYTTANDSLLINTSDTWSFTTKSTYNPPPPPPPINTPPTAKITGPSSGNVNTDITFDGSQSSDIDYGDSIVGYKWNFGDGTPETDYSTSATITHKFTEPAKYTVKLYVKDKIGAKDTDTLEIEILENTGEKFPPEAEAAGPYNGLVNETIELDGTYSSDRDGEIVNYTWDLDDGTTLYGEKIQHIYTESGKYTVTLTVTDNDGLTSEDTAEVNIQKDTDGDGFYDDVEESYGTNLNNPEDHPLDTDNDLIPDEKSPDDRYPGDTDDDNDGLFDEIEEFIIGSDPKNGEDAKQLEDGSFDMVYKLNNAPELNPLQVYVNVLPLGFVSL